MRLHWLLPLLLAGCLSSAPIDDPTEEEAEQPAEIARKTFRATYDGSCQNLSHTPLGDSSMSVASIPRPDHFESARFELTWSDVPDDAVPNLGMGVGVTGTPPFPDEQQMYVAATDPLIIELGSEDWPPGDMEVNLFAHGDPLPVAATTLQCQYTLETAVTTGPDGTSVAKPTR